MTTERTEWQIRCSAGCGLLTVELTPYEVWKLIQHYQCSCRAELRIVDES